MLDLLSTDDEFRALFVRDAQAAMEVAGYVHEDAGAAHPAFCYVVKSLAAKEDIARARSKLRTALNSIQHYDAPSEMLAR